MKVILECEPLGMNNTARAVEGNTISISKLMSLAGLNNLTDDIKFGASNDDIEWTATVIATSVLNVMQVAQLWQKQGYKIVD